jgi:hypothetical protein
VLAGVPPWHWHGLCPAASAPANSHTDVKFERRGDCQSQSCERCPDVEAAWHVVGSTALARARSHVNVGPLQDKVELRVQDEVDLHSHD